MYIKVRQNNKVVSIKEIKYLAAWTLDQLITDQAVKDQLEIDIKFQDTDDMGHVSDIDDRMDELPRCFELVLNKKLKRPSLVRTIIHECCHIKQIALGELDYPTLSCAVYKKKEYELESEKFWNTAHEYWKYPWEVEAYGIETCYYELYKHHVKENKLFPR